MSRVNEFKAGDRLNEARLKSWADAINRVHNFGPGKWEELSSELALFEVGDAWVAGSGPSATPPEPNGYYKSTDCHLVYYFPGTGEYHIKTGGDRGHTIWSINAGKTAPSLSPGDFAWCVYNIQASRWEVLTSTGESLVECCLAEDHPGYGVVFTVKLMVWDSDNNGHKPDPDDTETHYAIDWRYGMPYPDAGARGLFVKRRGYCGTDYVDMYEVVSLDCTKPTIACTEAEVASCP
jgi:hypothetical protein